MRFAADPLQVQQTVIAGAIETGDSPERPLDARVTAATEFRRTSRGEEGANGGCTGDGDGVAVSRGAGRDGRRLGHIGRDRRQRAYLRRAGWRQVGDRVGWQWCEP